MARTSYQRGRIEPRKRKWGMVWVLRYRVRDNTGRMRIEKTEQLAGCKSEKEARRQADKRMVEINRLNSQIVTGQTNLTFAQFQAGLWKDYLTRLKESSVATYTSLMKVELLPILGNKRLCEIKPADITELLKASRAR